MPIWPVTALTGLIVVMRFGGAPARRRRRQQQAAAAAQARFCHQCGRSLTDVVNESRCPRCKAPIRTVA